MSVVIKSDKGYEKMRVRDGRELEKHRRGEPGRQGLYIRREDARIRAEITTTCKPRVCAVSGT